MSNGPYQFPGASFIEQVATSSLTPNDWEEADEAIVSAFLTCSYLPYILECYILKIYQTCVSILAHRLRQWLRSVLGWRQNVQDRRSSRIRESSLRTLRQL
jgi:hypothetical protein